MLTRLPVLSAQTKVGNSSYKLKKKDQKSFYQRYKITKIFCNNLIKLLQQCE